MPDANCVCQDCQKLKDVQNELDSYQKCVENSLQQISSINIKYEHTVNELSTIINIFEYINLITDYKNLFSIINDMLIGVLGASSSTIFIYEEEAGFRIEASSLSRQLLKNMDQVGRMLLDKYRDCKEPFILNGEDMQDGFSRERGIKSAVGVPLNGKDKLMGVIYLEHGKESYFAPEIKRYLNTLATAIRLALENAQLYARLEEMALIDGLTGLYNRMFFNKEIQNCMDNYNRFGLPFMMAILDIDHFKKVNDTYGHLCGDLVLKEISELIKLAIRKDDFVCRYGGEEYAIIFRNTKDLDGICQRLEGLRNKMAETGIPFQENEVRVTCSIGVMSCMLVDKEGSIDEIVKKADEAMYEAKRTGRNKLCVAG